MNFEIDGTLPNLNEIIDASKSHWSIYSRMKSHYTNLTAYSIKDKRPLKCVNILITWYMPNKRQDKDNITAGQKFIIDGIVLAGVLKNDGWNEINDIYHSFKVCKKRPRVHVSLIEV